MDQVQANNSTQFAQTVPAFCRDASISRGMFYKLRKRSLKEGKGDPLRKLGKKAIVFPEIARAWLRAMAVTPSEHA